MFQMIYKKGSSQDDTIRNECQTIPKRWYQVAQELFLTDSAIALCWIENVKRQFKQYNMLKIVLQR